MKELYLLVDYKGQYESKSDSETYRGGMNLESLDKYFAERDYTLVVLNFSEVNIREFDWNNKIVLYTSQEDPGFLYKSFIEDIVYALELSGALIIPKFRYLRANNNKVFMELLRDIINLPSIKNIKTKYYGAIEELLKQTISNDYCVIKSAEGATSQGVFWGRNRNETIANARKASKTPIYFDDIKDFLRPFKYKGYIRNSRLRKKFIKQSFVPGLNNDWKILVFGDKYYLEYRGVRDNDFRASGSGRFLLNEDIPIEIPNGIFHFAESIRNALHTPHLSLDIGFKNNEFYLFEFQALYFSSYAHRMSRSYYKREGGNFIKKECKYPLEKVYADSVCDFIEKKLP